jgi:predicted nucleic acid-binding protein
MKYALDTNIIIRLLRDEPAVCHKFDYAVEHGYEIVIPALVHYEMKRGFLIMSAPKKEASYKVLLEQCPVVEMNIASLERGASIYANLYHAKLTVEDMDLLIAAFCLTDGYTLVTHNAKHFNMIENLAIEDWVEA